MKENYHSDAEIFRDDVNEIEKEEEEDDIFHLVLDDELKEHYEQDEVDEDEDINLY